MSLTHNTRRFDAKHTVRSSAFAEDATHYLKLAWAGRSIYIYIYIYGPASPGEFQIMRCVLGKCGRSDGVFCIKPSSVMC